MVSDPVSLKTDALEFPAAAATLQHVPIQLTRRGSDSQNRPILWGGPVLGSDPDREKLRHCRGWKPADDYAGDGAFNARIADPIAYIGAGYTHFGHFMAEAAHRIAPSLKSFGRGRWLLVSMVAPRLRRFEALPSYMRQVLDLFGITPDEVTVLAEDAIASELRITEQGSDLGGGPKPGYLDLLAELVHPRLAAMEQALPDWPKIFVSRSALGGGGGFFGSSYVEELLEKEGWHIFHPQKYSLAQQMRIYQTSRQAVFLEGSACHGTELLGTASLPETFLLCRRNFTARNFERILRPRAQSFYSCNPTIDIGTIFTSGRGGKILNHGVVALDPVKLLSFFRAHKLARLDRFSAEAYFACAEQDLNEYCAHFVNSSPPGRIPSLIGEVRTNFEVARARELAKTIAKPLTT